MSKVTFKVESLRRIPCPLGRDKDSESPQASYVVICNVQNLPEDIPMDTNPREQKLTTKVAKAIEKSLLYNREMNFHLLNRGLVISAESVKFNNDSNMLTLVFSNTEKHGNVDGGHTYKVILNNRSKLDFPQFVRLEILTGIEDFFEDVAGARNTSVQVQEKSLAELEGHFKIIKDALEDQPYLENIAYKENAPGEIDIADIVAILTMFNIKRFSDSSHPVIAYSSKKKCIDYYLEDIQKPDNSFEKLQKIIPDILRLYSYIEERMPVVYNEKDGGGKYGRVKGVVYKDGHSFYRPPFSSDTAIQYETPKGFIYPILAAFRVLVEENSETGYYEWAAKSNPLKYFDEVDKELVLTTVDRSRTLGNNPQSVGKDSAHWGQMYKIVQTKYLEKVIKMLRK